MDNKIQECYKIIERGEQYIQQIKDNALVEAYKYLQKYINESCHHLTIFDEMIDDIIQNASNYLENGMFYTGWNFYMKSLFENNKEHLVPACEKLNDIRKYHPIWVIFFKSKYKNYDTDTFASLSYRNIDIPEQLLKNDYIRINLNETYLDDKSFIKASIMHELTHVVNAYCKETNNTLLNKKNTIGYSLEENIFNFSETMLDKISEFLYILNKSEQEAFINGTIKYLQEEYKYELHNQHSKFDTIKLIENSYIFNKLDKFEQYVNDLQNEDDKIILAIGYYLQFHHYIYGTLDLNYVKKIIKNNELNKLDRKNVEEIKKSCDYFFKKYRHNLINAIWNETNK